MKIKLVALLAFVMLVLAGCGPGNTNTGNAGNGNGNRAGNSNTTSAAPTKDPNTVVASANPTSTTGGTSEGCKCSAAGMECNTAEGGKGCCGGKEGSCSTMAAGKSECCSKEGGGGASCCSTAGKTASTSGCGPGAKPAATTAPAGKS
ncbi:MAG TPA: hypothetical protein VM911_23640 [Pyrinomonadaceae bacterium]|nr:hypothetical protein [Pyrinomonadaceae bacterium]